MVLTDVLAMLSGLFNRKDNGENTITSVESMTLILRGMCGGTVYTFDHKSDYTKLCRYYEKYSNGENILELDESTACDIETMIRLMNKCNILGWNGFHGAHPKNVLDGIMFRFEAKVNNGVTVFADGSENFPKGYREFVRALDNMLTNEKTES